MSESIRLAMTSDVDRIEPLWRDLYAAQRTQGMRVEIPHEGFALWARSYAGTLARFSVIVVAESDAEIIGFVAGRLRTPPAWFGGLNVGFISEVYVAPERRGQGIAAQMLTISAAWFRNIGVHRLELHVLRANSRARETYESLGWTNELCQMVLELGDQNR